MKREIAILGTLDTKGEEVAYMKGLVEARGHSAILIDVGALGPPVVKPDIANEEVARLAGCELSNLLQTCERDRIMEVMGEGAGRLLLNLLREGRLGGVIGLGGNQGSAIASMAMKVLPLGFPKFLVSTVASGNIRPYIGHKDIGVMFSVSDLLGGPNPVTRSILANALSAPDYSHYCLGKHPAIRKPGNGAPSGKGVSRHRISCLRGGRLGHGGTHGGGCY
jgi:uncharacterized protein (UPF0261 family)